MPDEKSRFPLCDICQEHAPLESCNADEQGHVVHEECYVQKIAADGPSFARFAKGGLSTNLAPKGL